VKLLAPVMTVMTAADVTLVVALVVAVLTNVPVMNAPVANAPVTTTVQGLA